jgi:serine/threonine-protein kinase
VALAALTVISKQINPVTPPTKPTQTPKQNQPIRSPVSNTPNTSNTLALNTTTPLPVVSNTTSIPATTTPVPQKIRQKRTKRPFSLTEVLTSAAFIGFEGALISIGLISWLAFSGESVGIIGAVMGGIMFALHRRTIEKVDLIIFALITAGIVALIPKFHGSLTTPNVLIIATISAAAAIAITAFFRLVHQLLSRLL